ncbi:MAG: sodium:solute symporter family protein [Bacteroidota bacterium]
MTLTTIDWSFIILFFLVSLFIGIWVAKRSGQSSSEFFLSGRNMPWWLLGVSMVATTFSADTPNLVTDLVRKEGVAGNWAWWAFLLTGMLTVFVYARLWRRSGVMTDLEFYEMRYSGKAAAFLRGFRSLYLGVIFNILVMATVCLAAIKIGAVMLDFKPITTLLLASIITVAYSTLGGLRGIIITDFFQFGIAMIGTVLAAIYLLPEAGGLENVLNHSNVSDKLNILPDFNNSEQLWSLLIIPLAVQWWASYYPGSEPGGGGYIAQRMLAAKDETNAVGATLLYNIAHYALRPWPWIIIALCSLVVFPDLDSIQAAFPQIDPSIIDDDLAYSAMLTKLPHGLLGLVLASLIAAFMSTISTHLNWGSSYIANDFYRRFINPEATEKQLVNVGRISTVGLMVFAAAAALGLKNAKEAFDIIVLVGAGTGLIFILRWFWWRINAYSEIAAMIISFVVAIYFKFIHTKLGFEPLAGHTELISSVAITTIGWLLVTYLTRPTERETLVGFYEKIRPANIGWQAVVGQQAGPATGKLPMQILGMLSGCIAVYSALFATGFFIYGNTTNALMASVLTLISSGSLFVIWKRINT